MVGWQVVGADRPLRVGRNVGGGWLKHRKAVLASWAGQGVVWVMKLLNWL